MNLNFKANENLVIELKALVQKDREILKSVLLYLQEVEIRGLHLALGYPSLFEFATRELGYAAASAMRRIQAMRLMKSIPEVGALIESGNLSLSVAAQTQTFFKNENKRREPDSKRKVLETVIGLSSRECERKLAEISPEVVCPREKTRVISEDKTLIQFTAGRALMEKLDRLKELLSHKQIENRYGALFHELADLALKKLEKKDPTPTSEATRVIKGSRSRYITSEVESSVFKRDQNQCTYKDPKSGRVCGSRFFVQMDHVIPFAEGGNNTVENLRLLCGSHNRHRAISNYAS